MIATIHSIEFVKSSTDSNVGLTIKCESQDELKLWTSLGIKDEIVELKERISA